MSERDVSGRWVVHSGPTGWLWSDELAMSDVCQQAADVARFRAVEAEMPERMADVLRRRYGLGHRVESVATAAAALGMDSASVAELEREALKRLGYAFGLDVSALPGASEQTA